MARPYIKATFKIFEKDTDIAYLAGLFDGEGCIMFHKSRKVWRVVITSSDKIIIDWLTTLGGIPTPKKRYSDKHNPAWNWYLYRQTDVLAFLKNTYPYLKIKKDKAKQAIDEIERKI